MKYSLSSFILFLFTQFACAQITGTIKSAKGEPLSSVNIYIEDTFIGTTSNDEGIYELDITERGNYTIVFKYLGFKTEKQNISIEAFPRTVDMVLEEEEFTLDEVVLETQENPANRIIRQAIANRETMLEKVNAYEAKFYSRGLIRIKNAPEKLLGQEIGDLGGGLDSTRSGIIYLSETITLVLCKLCL